MIEFKTNLMLFFKERKELEKDTNIFLPNNLGLYSFLDIISGLVYMLPIYLFFTHKMPLYDFLTLILAFIALLGLLLFETEARQIVIKDGYIIERYYLVKEKKRK